MSEIGSKLMSSPHSISESTPIFAKSVFRVHVNIVLSVLYWNCQ